MTTELKPKTELEHRKIIEGYYFHTYVMGTEGEHDGKLRLNWQGNILAYIGDGYYLVVLFSYLTGGQTDHLIVNIEDMKDWTVYPDKEDFEYSYEHGTAFARRDVFKPDQPKKEYTLKTAADVAGGVD